MKKKFIAILMAMLMAVTLLPAISATADDLPLSVYVYGNLLEFDQNPIIVNGRTLVPMRGIFEALGMQVSWDDVARKVTANDSEKVIELTVGSNEAIVNGEGIALDVPAEIINGRTMVPLRFVGESTGNYVWWNDTMNKVRPRVVISPAHSDELKEALENFDKSCYSEKLLTWLANLYDPETGCFYFKTSAKDTLGFLPDAESTAKQLGTAAKMLGCSTDDILNEFTPEMRDKMLKYIQSSQSAEDGYWYEAPWGKYVKENKRLYETSAAKQLIALLGGKPLYPTNEERLAEGKTQKTVYNSSDSGINIVKLSTANMQKTAASADSRYSSKDAFKAWFDSLTWDTSLYGAGSLMLSNMGEIISAGYFDYAVELLTERIDPETGMLGYLNPETKTFDTHEICQDAMSGTYKIMGYWGQSYYPSMKGMDLNYPYVEKLIDSVIDVVMSDDVEYTNACHVSNAISLLSLYASKNVDSSAYNKLRKKLPDILNMTAMKAQRHMTPDGSYTYEPGAGAGGNQGSVHAYCLADGETSGASMMLALRENVYNVIGMPLPPLFDGKYTAKDFADMVKAIEPTKKIDFKTDASYTFNDMQPGPLPQNNGFRSTGDITIAEDPEYIGENAIRINAPGGDRPVLIIDAGTKSGKGFVCEFDIKISSPVITAYLLTFEFGSAFNSTSIFLNKSAGKYAFSSKAFDDWSDYKRVKIEYDVANGEGENKYYIDGELIYTGPHYSNGYSDMPAMENVPALQIRASSTEPFEAYIDNFEFHEKK